MNFFKKTWSFFLLAVLLIIFFKEIIFSRKYFFEDAVYLWYPYMNYLATMLRTGHIPFWTPYIFSGMPFFPDVLSQTFYPINWLLSLFVINGRLPFSILQLHMIFHIFLGGIFTYLYTKELKLNVIACLVSAFTFMFSGFLILHSIHANPVDAFIWLPLILFFLHRALTRHEWRYSMFAAIFFAMSMLAGFPQYSLYIAYFLGLYVIAFVIIHKKYNGRDLRYAFFVLVIVAIIGVGIAAIQYLPSFKYANYTLRENMSYKNSVEHSLNPLQLITLLVPKFFGSVTGMGTDSVNYWLEGYGHFWETGIYIGILPLLLAIIALLKKRDKLVWFYGIVAGLMLLFALGKYSPLYKIAYYVLPGINRFRIPGRFACIFTFAMSILAGFGMDALLAKKFKQGNLLKGLFIFLGGFILIYFLFVINAFKSTIANFLNNKMESALFIDSVYSNIVRQYGISIIFVLISIILIWQIITSTKRKTLFSGLALGIIFIDLYIFGHNFNASDVNPEDAYAETALIKSLQKEREKEIFRINMRDGRNMLFERNSGNIYRLEFTEGYTPLSLEKYAHFNIPAARKWDLLNAKYKILVEGQKSGLTLNPTYLPRAKMFYKYQVINNSPDILNLLSQDSFDYHTILILQKQPDIEITGTDSTNEVKIVKYEPSLIQVEVKTTKPGLLFLSEIYYPEWKAYVDGQKTEILCADNSLRAVALKQGEHKVIFKFDSSNFRKGLIISLITILITGCSLLLVTLKRKTNISSRV